MMQSVADDEAECSLNSTVYLVLQQLSGEGMYCTQKEKRTTFQTISAIFVRIVTYPLCHVRNPVKFRR